MAKKILIGGAWPYANGSLHIGHIAGLLPGDVIARYYRAKGDDVYYVSGSDCYGTPVTIRAKQEEVSPEEISNRYHEEFKECFRKLGFSYDYYGKTSQSEHIEFVKAFHKKLYESPYVYEKTAPQAYCRKCHQFLPDRFVEGICPTCGKKTRGDQCDACGTVLEPEQLHEARCTLCGETPEFRDTKHLYIAISQLEQALRQLVDTHPNWRKNATQFTKRYIEEGLRDRALTRDLDWGIDVPCSGYEGKKIYIWAENVLGYLSMSQVVARKRGVSFKELWGNESKHYYIHAKDNIPFHTIILPALLIAEGEGYHLPDEIISNEYLTLEGRKISTSQNWAIWLKDIVERYHPDSLRYFLISNGPEKRDTDFTWNEYVNSHNGELLGAYGNLVNRVLVFIEKYFGDKVPEGILETEIEVKIKALYDEAGQLIETGSLKEALDAIFEFVRFSNKYFDSRAPWATRVADIKDCENTLYNCIQIIANLATLLAPFLSFSSEQLGEWLGVDLNWTAKTIQQGTVISKSEILFERLDKKLIEAEKQKLNH